MVTGLYKQLNFKEYFMQNKGKFLKVMAAIAITAAAAFSDTQDNVAYIDSSGAVKSANNVTVIDSWNIAPVDNLNGWYLIDKSMKLTRNTTLTVLGAAHIILEDGCDLSVTGTSGDAGIKVCEGNALTIYAQSTGDNIGKLMVNVLAGSAGIGGGRDGDNGENAGEIAINGGNITAFGGWGAAIGGGGNSSGAGGAGGKITINGGTVLTISLIGAGIGGGAGDIGGNGGEIIINGGNISGSIGGGNGNNIGGSGGKIVINDGKIISSRGSGAGIGGGAPGGAGEEITINGGDIEAISGNTSNQSVLSASGAGAGIGGGGGFSSYGSNPILGGNGGKIIINGGKITAKSSGSYGGAGIGGGGIGGNSGEITINGGNIEAHGGNTSIGTGVGIGGGYGGDGEKITISGGNIIAKGGYYDAGIGGGAGGNGGEVVVIGGNVTATGGYYGAGIGGGRNGNGGEITISGGNIIAKGGSSTASGIGGGDGGAAGGLTLNGDAIVLTNRVDDYDESKRTGGILFVGNIGKVYGDVELKEDFEIEKKYMLGIPNGAALTNPSNTTLTVADSATLSISGGATLTNGGTIIACGTITGVVTGNQPQECGSTPIGRIAEKKVAAISFAGIKNGQISLNLKAGDYTVELYNIQGRLINRVNITATNGVNATGLKTDNLAKGMFILNVKQGSVSVLKRKIKI
jgi:hypothetical protein